MSSNKTALDDLVRRSRECFVSMERQLGGSSTAEAGVFQKWAAVSLLAKSTACRNNFRAALFHDLYQALSTCSRFPEGHPLHLKTEAYSKAIDFLGVCEANTDVQAPKFFPHEEESVFLKWMAANTEKLLYLSEEGEVTLATIGTDGVAEVSEFGTDWVESPGEVFKAIGAAYSSSSLEQTVVDA